MPDTTITTRWINLWEATKEEITQIDFLVDSQGWVKLNLNTTRVLVAEVSGRITDFSIVQLMPYVGPLYVSPEHRGSAITQQLADETVSFLQSVDTRGWLVMAQSRFVEKMCEERKWPKITHPMYMYDATRKGE